MEVSPGTYRGASKNDFFAGKFDGNWRIKVIPRNDTHIPNFVVIGNGVMGKAVYTKRLGIKEEMCTDCYKTNHFRKDCPGGRHWLDYCKEFTSRDILTHSGEFLY